MKMYLFVTHNDIESEITGPFKNSDERDEAAREIREDEGEETGIFMLNVGSDGVPECSDYSGGFFDGEEEDDGEAETIRRDERNGLYGMHVDDAN